MSQFRTRLPPPGALIVFEAVARRLGFTAAARELGVSQAATSRQVRILEDHLGAALFRREGRQIRLTEAGEQLQLAVTMGLGHIASTVDALRAPKRGKDLTVATSIAFSAFWLMPRLPGFHAAYPELELRLVTSDSEADWLAGNVDVAVVFGSGGAPGVVAEPLFGDQILAVCHPDYFAGRRPPRTAVELRDQVLLQHETEHPSWITWPSWFAHQGVDSAKPLQGPHFNNYTMIVQAALDGQGIGLGWRRLIGPQLEAGRLRQVTQASVVPEEGYAVVMPESRRDDPKVAAFRDWIMAEAAEDWR